MSPGGTDSMQISNWKRITQIHHCISARTVATVHSKYTKRQKKMEEMCSHWFVWRCWSGISDEVRHQHWAPIWRTQTSGMVPMLRIPPAAFSPCSSLSFLRNLWFLHLLKTCGQQKEGNLPKKTDAHLASPYCHRASVFRDHVISQSVNLQPQSEADKCDIGVGLAVHQRGQELLFYCPATSALHTLDVHAACHPGCLNIAALTLLIKIKSQRIWCGPPQLLLERIRHWLAECFGHSHRVCICCHASAANASNRIVIMLPWKCDF